jgi:hypothetical protein
MMPVITLTTGQTADIEPGGCVGLVCEAAPDGTFRSKFPDAVSFAELFGDRNKTRERAAVLAHRLVESEPSVRGIQQLRVFEEVVITELESIFLVLNLVDWMKANRIGMCQLHEESWVSGFTRILTDECQIGVETLPRSNDSHKATYALCQRASRVIGRMRQSGFSRAALYREWRQLLDHVDPYHRRASFGRRRREWRPGDIWYYTTAHTFTNVGLEFELYAPASFNFLVENPLRGGAPIKARSRKATSLYEFSAMHFAPSRSEIENARQRIVRHLLNVRLCSLELRARDIFLSGKYFSEFCEQLLPQGLYYTQLFENWAKRTRPAALVVGNYVYEAYALLAARRHGIRTVLLQHGAFGTDYGCIELPIDHYIARGKFWQSFLPGATRSKSTVLNIYNQSTPELPKERRRSLLFLTAPYSMQPFWTESDLDDILAALLRCALRRGVELIIRVHPLEDKNFYRRRIATLLPSSGDVQLITYSQDDGLDDVLARSAVAVTFSSTTFLDCLRWQVPIVSFDWHDFSYKNRIRDHGVFQFAGSLAELEDLVVRALSGDLPPFRDGVEPFLASTSAEELTREIGRMIGTASIADTPQRGPEPELTAGLDIP